jgi:hypothetical protein
VRKITKIRLVIDMSRRWIEPAMSDLDLTT